MWLRLCYRELAAGFLAVSAPVRLLVVSDILTEVKLNAKPRELLDLKQKHK